MLFDIAYPDPPLDSIISTPSPPSPHPCAGLTCSGGHPSALGPREKALLETVMPQCTLWHFCDIAYQWRMYFAGTSADSIRPKVSEAAEQHPIAQANLYSSQ